MITPRKVINIIKLKIKSFFTKDEKLPIWAKERLSVCEECPLNSKNTKLTDKNFRYWKWWFTNLGKDFCTDCGCELKPKAMSEYENCPKDKWRATL